MDEPVNILIHGLDDNPNDIELMKRTLDSENITNYKLYVSAKLFMQEFHKGVHLTIVDYVLGGKLTGLDILKHINNINPNCYNIIVSAFANPETVIEFSRNGASDFVSKNNSNYLQDIIGAIKRAFPVVEKWVNKETEWTKFADKWRPQIEQH